MIVSLTLCPLCQGPLKLDTTPPLAKVKGSGVAINKYICQKLVEASNISHYTLYVTGSGPYQEIALPPYYIQNDIADNICNIQSWDSPFKHIISCPAIKIESIEKTMERIKKLIVFS